MQHGAEQEPREQSDVLHTLHELARSEEGRKWRKDCKIPHTFQ